MSPSLRLTLSLRSLQHLHPLLLDTTPQPPVITPHTPVITPEPPAFPPHPPLITRQPMTANPPGICPHMDPPPVISPYTMSLHPSLIVITPHITPQPPFIPPHIPRWKLLHMVARYPGAFTTPFKTETPGRYNSCLCFFWGGATYKYVNDRLCFCWVLLLVKNTGFRKLLCSGQKMPCKNSENQSPKNYSCFSYEKHDFSSKIIPFFWFFQR